MVNFRFGGASNPPDNVKWVRILAPPAEHDKFFMPSMVSADFDIKMAADWWNPFACSMVKLWSKPSSCCCDALRIHFAPLGLSVDECADVERTNWRTCFCWAVKKVAPCDETVESGCCKKLVNFAFVAPAPLVLVDVVVVENFCTCFSVTIFMLEWALSCCISVAFDRDADWSTKCAVDDVLDDCRLWLRVLCDLTLVTLTVVPVPAFTVVAVDVVVVVDDLSSSSSSFSSPGAVTMYCGGSASSTDIFAALSHKRTSGEFPFSIKQFVDLNISVFILCVCGGREVGYAVTLFYTLR